MRKGPEEIREFGRNLRKRRMDAGLTVRALAAKAAISFALLTCIENARRGAGRSTLEKLGRALGLHGPELAEFVLQGMVIGKREKLLSDAEGYPVHLLNALPLVLRQLGVTPSDVRSIQLPTSALEEDLVVELRHGRQLVVSFKMVEG